MKPCYCKYINLKINKLANDIPLGCIDYGECLHNRVYTYVKHTCNEMLNKINTFTRITLYGLKSYVLSSETNTLL